VKYLGTGGFTVQALKTPSGGWIIQAQKSVTEFFRNEVNSWNTVKEFHAILLR
jgi:hypothetical protein